MKNNNKNRKLKFIREKNNLRLGKTKFYCFEKCSNSIETDNVSKNGVNYWIRLIDIAKKSLLKNYKLTLPSYQIFPKQLCDDDFVKDLHTNCVVLSLK
jgi:hypothetical protein